MAANCWATSSFGAAFNTAWNRRSASAFTSLSDSRRSSWFLAGLAMVEDAWPVMGRLGVYPLLVLDKANPIIQEVVDPRKAETS